MGVIKKHTLYKSKGTLFLIVQPKKRKRLGVGGGEQLMEVREERPNPTCVAVGL